MGRKLAPSAPLWRRTARCQPPPEPSAIPHPPASSSSMDGMSDEVGGVMRIKNGRILKHGVRICFASFCRRFFL